MKKNFKVLMSLMMAMLILQAAVFAGPFGRGEKKAESKQQDIVQIASQDKEFATLVAALGAAGLTETLEGEGPFTVFAPTNAAFEKLPAGTVQELLKPENKEQLTKILTYHVTPGKLTSKDLTKECCVELTMANGMKAKVTVKDGNVFINDAKVIKTDIKASNGVIHVIDTVIMPK